MKEPADSLGLLENVVSVVEGEQIGLKERWVKEIVKEAVSAVLTFHLILMHP